MGQMIEFQRPDGQTAKGYLAEAANPVGAVVVIQEWWGLNDQIRTHQLGGVDFAGYDGY
jgi:carboxymethylenebutenolidase